MKQKEVFALLSNALSVKVYPDQVPESAPKPAVSFVNAGYARERVISGKATGEWSTWRVTIVTTSLADVELLIDELKLLDNTKNDDFQRIFVDLVSVEGKVSESPYRRAFVDLRVY